MAQTSINIRIGEELKRQSDSFCSEIGMSIITAFCVFAKTVVREQRIPFELKLDEPNSETYAAAAEKNEDMYGPFDSVAEMMEALNA